MLASFNMISLYDKLNLVIIPDTLNYAEIKGGENVIDLISTDIKNGELILQNNNRFNWTRSYEREITVFLHAIKIRHIRFYGSGKITSTTTITTDTLEMEMFKAAGSITLDMNAKAVNCIQHTGPSDVTLTGNADVTKIYSGGNGFIYIDKLNSRSCLVNNSGTGDMYVKARDYLEVQVFYIGSVFYTGKPSTIASVIKGKGTVSEIQ
jgi:Putative auto-transporter adhesin, head GIN domain